MKLRRMCSYLVEKGFTPYKVKPDYDNLKYTVYLFSTTPELHRAVMAYVADRAQHEEKGEMIDNKNRLILRCAFPFAPLVHHVFCELTHNDRCQVLQFVYPFHFLAKAQKETKVRTIPPYGLRGVLPNLGLY